MMHPQVRQCNRYLTICQARLADAADAYATRRRISDRGIALNAEGVYSRVELGCRICTSPDRPRTFHSRGHRPNGVAKMLRQIRYASPGNGKSPRN